MAAPLSEADVVAAAPLVAFVEKISTGEQLLVLAFDTDPLATPIPEDRHVADPALFNDVTAEWLSLFTWPPTAPLSLSSLPLLEPEPKDDDGEFTAERWTAIDVARMVADYKAEAAR